MKARLNALWQRICWNAWNYARKRENKRRALNPALGGRIDDESPEYRRQVAAEAAQLLDNRHFIEAFAAVDASIEAQAVACNPNDKDHAQRIIIAKQIAQQFRREILRKLDDGYMAEVQIEAIERQRGMRRFQR
jgi:hypothetical protein